MFELVQKRLPGASEQELWDHERTLTAEAKALAHRAFVLHDRAATLEAHRTLYALHLAQLGVPWQAPSVNHAHPVVAKIRYCLQSACDRAEELAASRHLGALPPVNSFRGWITGLVQKHAAYPIHPVFFFLRDSATHEQLQQFLFQETPLEMLFGDIVACMLPGVYGEAKAALARNFWDEVGRAQDDRVHRNLRAKLMHRAGIAPDAHITAIGNFVVEELALVNMYLGMAFNRCKLTQLIGSMLATELVIPGRFEYLIAGWLRVGLDAPALDYLTEHTTVDEGHAEDWLEKVVGSVLAQNPAAMREIAIGVVRRLNNAYAVTQALQSMLLTTTQVRNPETQQHSELVASL